MKWTFFVRGRFWFQTSFVACRRFTGTSFHVGCSCLLHLLLLVRSKHLFLQVSLFDTSTNIAIRTNASCSKVGKPDLRDVVSAVIQDKQFQLMTPIAGLLCNNPARAYPKNHPIAYFHAA